MSLGLILIIILIIFLLGEFQRALRRLWIRLRSWRRWSHRHDLIIVLVLMLLGRI